MGIVVRARRRLLDDSNQVHHRPSSGQRLLHLGLVQIVDELHALATLDLEAAPQEATR